MGLHPIAAGYRRADYEVFLSRISKNQNFISRQQEHEERQPSLARDILQSLAQIGWVISSDRTAAITQHRGPRMVGRQLD